MKATRHQSLKVKLAAALAMAVGMTKYTKGMGFLPTRKKLQHPADVELGGYCVESGDGEILGVDLSLVAARRMSRMARNAPGRIFRGAHVINQRTGERVNFGTGQYI